MDLMPILYSNRKYAKASSREHDIPREKQVLLCHPIALNINHVCLPSKPFKHFHYIEHVLLPLRVVYDGSYSNGLLHPGCTGMPTIVQAELPSSFNQSALIPGCDQEDQCVTMSRQQEARILF